eukprot:9411060-Pyramimonas_sp.AAC.1
MCTKLRPYSVARHIPDAELLAGRAPLALGGDDRFEGAKGHPHAFAEAHLAGQGLLVLTLNAFLQH